MRVTHHSNNPQNSQDKREAFLAGTKWKVLTCGIMPAVCVGPCGLGAHHLGASSCSERAERNELLMRSDWLKRWGIGLSRQCVRRLYRVGKRIRGLIYHPTGKLVVVLRRNARKFGVLFAKANRGFIKKGL